MTILLWIAGYVGSSFFLIFAFWRFVQFFESSQPFLDGDPDHHWPGEDHIDQ
jgi:hypothetical protein